MADTQNQNPELTPAAVAGASMQAALQESQNKRAEADERQKKENYEAMSETEKLLFGQPAEGQTLSQAAWERLKASKGNEVLRQRIMLSMKNAARKLFDAMTKRAKARRETTADARKKEDTLKSYLRMVGVIGQSLKIQNKSHVVEEQLKPGETLASGDVLDTEEALMLDKFCGFLDALDLDELIRTIEEDEIFVEMLVQTSEARGITEPPTPDGLPKEPGKVPAQKPKLLDLNQDVAERETNYHHLIRLILREKSPGATREKSHSRQLTEAVMWLQIVGNLTHDQRGYLTDMMVRERGVQVTQGFLEEAVRGGVMTRVDLEEMQRRQVQVLKDEELTPHLPGMQKTLANVLTPTFLDGIDGVMQERVAYVKGGPERAKRVEQEYIGSAAQHFFTFNKLLAGRLFDFGVLTAGLNFGLSISEEMNRHGGTFMGGVKKGLENKWTWFGLAEVVASAEVVMPGGVVGRVIHSPSQNERERVVQDKASKFFLETLRNRPSRFEYFKKHFEGYMDIANTNFANAKGDRGIRNLYPGDVTVTLDDAVSMGFTSVVEATSAMHLLFDAAINHMKLENNQPLDTKERLENFYKKNILKK